MAIVYVAHASNACQTARPPGKNSKQFRVLSALEKKCVRRTLRDRLSQAERNKAVDNPPLLADYSASHFARST